MPIPLVIDKISRVTRKAQPVGVVFRQALVNFLKEDSLTISAAIAYFGLLSLFPLLLLLVSLSGMYIRHYELSGELTVVLQSFLPIKPDFIMQKLVEISRAFGRVSLVSLLLLLWSAAGMFLPLEKALNRAWEVEHERSWWRSYLVAMEMALLFALFIAAYTALAGANIYVHRRVDTWITVHSAPALTEFIYQLLFAAVTFGMTLIVFTILFQRLPNRILGSRKVLPGALVTTVLWETARTSFTHLLPLFNYSHVYGSIAVVVTLMTWLYISSAITLFGAHVSRSLYRTLKAPAPAQAPDVASTVQSAGEVP